MNRKVLLQLIVFLLITIPSIVFAQNNSSSNGNTSKKIPFSFKLDSSANTSAGVYKKDGTLLRTLWSGVRYDSGSHMESWDGLDDQGKVVSDSFDIKILSSNVTYTWNGTFVGNTGTNPTGPNQIKAGFPPRGMAIVGDNLYVALDYNEGLAAHGLMSLSNVYDHLSPIGTSGGTGAMQVPHVCTDGVNVYWGGFDNQHSGIYESFIDVTKVSDNSIVHFTNGVPIVSSPISDGYPSVLAYRYDDVNTSQLIGSLKVQQTGNYLFAARGANTLQVIDKRTTHGEVVQSITIPNIGKLEVDGSDNLWMQHSSTIEKYTVNTDGTITTTGITISVGTANIGAITFNTDGTRLAVADMDAGLIRYYNPSTGAYISSFGDGESYITSATVRDNKFYWKDVRQTWQTFITYLPDGSFFVGDGMNRRVQHFAANGTFIKSFGWLGYNYSCGTVPNHPTRLFSGKQAKLLEFEIDYSKPLDARNGSWKLKNNWQGNFVNPYLIERGLRSIQVLSNGRTYGLVSGSGDDHYYEVELVDGGAIRYTGTTLGFYPTIDIDGSELDVSYGSGQPSRLIKYPLLNFDGSNNPVRSTTPQTLFSVPVNSHDPQPTTTITSTGKLLFYNAEKVNATDGLDVHIALADTAKMLWRTGYGTPVTYQGPYPDDTHFDNGNGVIYPGGPIMELNNNIFQNYHGEFWKNTQTNRWLHIDARTGLMVGSFGTVASDYAEGARVAGVDGNILEGSYVEVNGQGYIWHNGESSGLHQWQVHGLETIQIQTATFPTSNIATDAPQGVNLLEGITWGLTTLPNGIGWTRSKPESSDLATSVGTLTYDKLKQPDLRFLANVAVGASENFTRTLGTNIALSSWSLKSKVTFIQHNFPYNDGTVICDLSIKDALGKNIAVFDLHRDDAFGYIIRVNGQTMHTTLQFDKHELETLYSYYQTMEMNYSGGLITFKFAGYSLTTSKYDNTSDATNPTTLVWTSHNVSSDGPKLHTISFKELRFINTTPIKDHFRSKSNGNYNDIATWEHSTDSTTWEAATQIPTTAANSIVIQSGHTISVFDTATVAKITVKDGGVLNVMPNAAITVNDAEGDDIIIEAGGHMNIKSDTTGNGRIAASTGTIKGNVTVEHFIPARGNGGYRLLGPSVNTTTSIKSNWQEGVNNSNVNMITNPFHGCGTHITGSINGANGFDASLTGQASLFTYNQTTPTQTWSSISNTDVNTFDAKKGCLIFIHGSRSINLNDVSVKSDNTILRATGSIISGTVNYKAMEGNGRNSLVTNPYASSINWVTLQESNSTKFENYYTFWDPNIGSQGGYVTVDATGTTSVRTSSATTEIQSGQAFLIKAKPGVVSPDFTIQESHKSAGSNLGVFKTTGVPPQKLYASLYYNDINSNRILADGVLARFSNDYARDVDGNDADDMSNFDENIAFVRNKTTLSIESRPSISTSDTLFLRVNNVKTQHYEWQFNASDFDSSMIMKPYLKDAFLKTETKISVTQTTVIGFDVTTNPFSAAQDRFSIVFKSAETLPVKMLSVKASETDGGVKVDWKTTTEINMDKYEVEKSVDGQSFSLATTVVAKGTSTSINDYAWLDVKPETGNNYYRIRSINKDGSFDYSVIVKVWVSKSGNSSLNIYPNPVQGKDFNIDMKNFKKGKYSVKLLSTSGQTISTNTFDHPGGSATQKVNVNKAFAPGTYLVQVVGSNETSTQYIMKR